MATSKSQNPTPPRRTLAGVDVTNVDSVFKLPAEQQYRIGAYSNYVDKILRDELAARNPETFPQFEQAKIDYFKDKGVMGATFERDVEDLFKKHNVQPLSPQDTMQILAQRGISPQDYQLLNQLSLSHKYGYVPKDVNDPSFTSFGGEHFSRGIPSAISDAGTTRRYKYNPQTGQVEVLTEKK